MSYFLISLSVWLVSIISLTISDTLFANPFVGSLSRFAEYLVSDSCLYASAPAEDNCGRSFVSWFYDNVL